MKGLNAYGLRGRQISYSLIALICFTVLLYAWEKNPFVTVDQFSMASSGIIVDSAGNSLEKNTGKGDIELIAKKETQAEDDYAAGKMNIYAAPTEIKQIDENYTFPTEPKVLSTDVSSHSSQIEKVESHNNESRTGLIKSQETKKKEDGHVPATMNFKAASSESEGKVCNYAKGRWVADSRHPLYSGLGCKQWLSGMWACRLTQRTDFSYEGYRWQPENCAMSAFERSAFLKRMQDKTIAFVGDSLGRQQFQSLMCMATGGEESPEVQDVGKEYGLVKARGAVRPDGWAYWFPNTNTTILYYWSASLTGLEPVDITNPATDVAMHLDRPPAFLRRFLHRFDVLVLNTGHHWNRGKLQANRWVMYVNGKPLKDKKLAQIANAKNFTVYSIARWVDSQLPSHPRLKAFFRTISPRHFKHGDWNSGGSCDNTTPLSNGDKVLQNGSSDNVVEGALRGTKVKILDITALSELRDEGHISHYSIKANQGINDCLHWCLPGIPDAWNELLYAQI